MRAAFHAWATTGRAPLGDYPRFFGTLSSILWPIDRGEDQVRGRLSLHPVGDSEQGAGGIAAVLTVEKPGLAEQDTRRDHRYALRMYR